MGEAILTQLGRAMIIKAKVLCIVGIRIDPNGKEFIELDITNPDLEPAFIVEVTYWGDPISHDLIVGKNWMGWLRCSPHDLTHADERFVRERVIDWCMEENYLRP